MDTEVKEPGTALTVQDRAALALGSSQIRIDLQAMVLLSANITDIKDKAGRDEAHSRAMALANARISITKTGKIARDDAVKFSKAVLAEEDELIKITSPEEKRLLAMRDAWDETIAAEKAAKAAAERARITAIHARIAEITSFSVLAVECRTAERVQTLIDKVTAISLENFEEFDTEAKTAHADTLARLEQIHAAKFAEESERARVKAEQAAEQARLDAMRRDQEAAAAAERERLARQAAEQEKAAVEAQRQREAQDAELAEQRAAFAREQAAARELLDAQARELDAKQDAMEAQKPATVTVTLTNPPLFTAPDPLPYAAEVETALTEFDAAVLDTKPDNGPSEAEIVFCAAGAVSAKFKITFMQALERLSNVQQWIL